MSTKLRFDLAAALRLAEHAVAAPHKLQSFTEADAGATCPGAMVWSNDHGVYLMSGGSPGLLVDPDNPDRGQVIVYAEGYKPGNHHHDPVLGGDDFAEHIHLTDHHGSRTTLIEALRTAKALGFRWLVLHVSTRTYHIGIS